MTLFDRFRKAEHEERAAPILSYNDYLQILNQFSYNGFTYSYGNSAPQEEIASTFASMAHSAYKSNGVVFACMLARRSLFTEATLKWRRKDGRRDLFGNQDLSPLETPWPGGTTGDLLARAIDYADLSGNFYATLNRRTGGVIFLRPDWVTIVAGNQSDAGASLWDPNTELLGYRYQPGGPGSGEDPIFYLADEVAHFAPNPDPEARFLGMSWLTPIVREIMADKAATDHKLRFFENGATPNMVVKLNVQDLDKFTKWMQKFREDHEGADNAYRTIFLGAGADVTVVGADLQQIDFKVTQGAGETRIAAAAGVPPVIVGLSEGLQAATYSNYSQARRRFADGTMWPLWRNFCGSMERILNVPGGAQLWVDSSDIPFLREDEADVASIQFTNAQAIKQLTDAGFTADSVIAAVTSNDLTQLEHSGLFSVQLQPPGTQTSPQPPAPQNDANKQLRSVDYSHQVMPAPNVSVNFNERSFVNETSAPEVKVEFADGAFRMDSPKVDVSVEAPPPAETKVEIAERAIVVEAPPPAEVNVTVEAPPPAETRVEISERAVVVEPQIEVKVEAPPPAEPSRVEFAEGAFRVEAPPPAEITVDITPDLRAHLELSDSAVEALRATPDVVVNIEPTPVTVENTVNVPETPVNVNLDQVPLEAEITYKRGRNGQIESAKLTESDNGY